MIRLLRRKRTLQIICVLFAAVLFAKTVRNYYDPERALRSLPHVIIMGAPRTGTIALNAFIGLHPNVKSYSGREINFFGSQANFNRGIHWYTSKIPKVNNSQILVETSPQYFYSTEAPHLMKEMFPTPESVKIVIVVRDPLKRLLSEYADITAKTRAKNRKTLSFYKSVIDPSAELVNTTYPPVMNGVYAVGLQRWLNYFSKEQIHYVDGENLISDPIDELEKLENFLGLKHLINEDQMYFNKVTGFFCVKKPNGKPQCLPRYQGYEEPRVDQTYLEIVRLFYIHHNKRFTALSGVRFNWQDEEEENA